MSEINSQFNACQYRDLEHEQQSHEPVGALSVENGVITLDVAKVAASPQGRAVLEKIRQIKVSDGRNV